MYPVLGCKYPIGTIILACGSRPRFGEFQDALEMLKIPSGTRYQKHVSYDVCDARNAGLDARHPDGDWVLFLDDDQTFNPDYLLDMLAAMYSTPGCDVLAPIVSRRVEPFDPIAMRPGGTPYTWPELVGQGPLKLKVGSSTGMGGFLIKESALRRLEQPFFAVGQFRPGHMQEDIWFCQSLMKASIPIWLNRSIVQGHSDTATIVPVQGPDGWEVEVRIGRAVSHNP